MHIEFGAVCHVVTPFLFGSFLVLRLKFDDVVQFTVERGAELVLLSFFTISQENPEAKIFLRFSRCIEMLENMFIILLSAKIVVTGPDGATKVTYTLTFVRE